MCSETSNENILWHHLIVNVTHFCFQTIFSIQRRVQHSNSNQHWSTKKKKKRWFSFLNVHWIKFSFYLIRFSFFISFNQIVISRTIWLNLTFARFLSLKSVLPFLNSFSPATEEGQVQQGAEGGVRAENPNGCCACNIKRCNSTRRF